MYNILIIEQHNHLIDEYMNTDVNPAYNINTVTGNNSVGLV